MLRIEPMGGVNDPSFVYYLKLRCGNCGEVTEKETCVSLEDIVNIPKSRGQANLVQKCKFCSREGTITMIPGGGSPIKFKLCRPLTGEDCEAGNYAPLMGAVVWSQLSTHLVVACGKLKLLLALFMRMWSCQEGTGLNMMRRGTCRFRSAT